MACQQKAWYRKNVPTDDRHQLAKQLSEGAAHYYQGSVANMMLLEEGIKMDSTIPDLWREMATPYLKRGMPNQAFKYYKREIALAPELWQGWRGYLYLYFYHDYHRAIADFNATDTLTVITDYPQGQSVDYMRGLSYYGLKEYAKALEFFNRYISDVTRERGEEWVDTYAFLYRGMTLERLQRYDESIKDFETGAKYDARLADFHFHKARILYEHLGANPATVEGLLTTALQNFQRGYFHQRDYVEVHDQLYLEDIKNLRQKVSLSLH
jgi:tetratricopeptide (TPR) repeat protein